MNHTESDSIGEEVAASQTLLTRLKYLAYFGFACAAVVIGLYFYNFRGDLAGESSRWGEFGDFVGGVLNPTFSLLALIALLSTIALQIRELRLSAKELKNSADALAKQNETLRQQNFESSFFQLLRLHADIVSSIDLASANGPITRGRDCFKIFVRRLESALRGIAADRDFDAFTVQYKTFHIEHEHEVGHYFRLLYNIIKLVNRTDGIDKHFYTNLVRAQLSSYELKLLFYNGLSAWGIEKFKPLIEQFALLKTLPNAALPNDVLLRKYDPTAFGGTYPESLI